MKSTQYMKSWFSILHYYLSICELIFIKFIYIYVYKDEES